MRVIFMGTGEFAIPALKALHADGYRIIAVITQPDRAKDRKGNIIEGELKKTALELGLEVYQFEKIKLHAEELRRLNPDFMVTASYGQILSREILDIAPIYNVHASLLPKYRGSAPIQWAIINGESETGVTIMKTEEGLDTGDILSFCKVPIYEGETYGELFDILKVAGAELLSETLIKLKNNQIIPIKQDSACATKCRMLTNDVAKIDWSKSNTEIINLIRGLNPKPGAFTTVNDNILKILSAQADEGNSLGIGKIEITKQIKVGCGRGNIIIKKLQLSGKKEMLAENFINGNRGLNGLICI